MPLKDRKRYNEYMRSYLPNYRRMERELLNKAKTEFGWQPPKSGKPKPKTRRRTKKA